MALDPTLALTQYALFVFSTVCHEGAHAWAALRGGDDTAARGGQAGLDPLPHIRREPIGMIVAPLIGIFTGGYVFGWASTPYNVSWAEAYPKRAAAMALAGPLANLALVLLSAAAMRIGIAQGAFAVSPALSFSSLVVGIGGGVSLSLAVMLSVLFTLNLLLFFFNLIPFAPLDGAAALALLPGGEKLSAFLSQPRFRMIGLLAAWLLFPTFFRPIMHVCLGLLFAGLL